MENKPKGVYIFGSLNLVLGIIFLLTSLTTLLTLSPKKWEDFKTNLPQNFPSEINFPQFKAMLIFQIIISLIFIASGLGLLLKKEWARKLTIYFSFVYAFLTVVSLVFTPTLIKQALPQVIYPGILIFYFTHREIEDYFKKENLNKT
jgi:uncharacterized membrane protein